MKHFLLIGILFAICHLVLLCGAVDSTTGSLYQGTFTGTATGDSGSSAQLTLNLLQNGAEVSGTATIGEGLMVDTGGAVCPGVVSVPSGTIDVQGSVSSQNPTHLEAKSSITAMGLTITGDVGADLSQDGKNMDITIKLNVPWPCHGTTIKANLSRST
jgi:hypothetical protein